MNNVRKSPVLAGILSLMPGLGQIYVGYYVGGFVQMLVVGATIATLNSGRGFHHENGMEPFLGFFLAFFWLFGVIDAVRKATAYNLHNQGEQEGKLPTDSPLVGGVVLVVAGILFTLKVTFGLEMEWVAQVWPLGLLVGGAYLLWKYQRTREALRNGGPGTRAGSGGGPDRTSDFDAERDRPSGTD